jgi:hypothetical protein
MPLRFYQPELYAVLYTRQSGTGELDAGASRRFRCSRAVRDRPAAAWPSRQASRPWRARRRPRSGQHRPADPLFRPSFALAAELARSLIGLEGAGFGVETAVPLRAIVIPFIGEWIGRHAPLTGDLRLMRAAARLPLRRCRVRPVLVGPVVMPVRLTGDDGANRQSDYRTCNRCDGFVIIIVVMAVIVVLSMIAMRPIGSAFGTQGAACFTPGLSFGAIPSPMLHIGIMAMGRITIVAIAIIVAVIAIGLGACGDRRETHCGNRQSHKSCHHLTRETSERRTHIGLLSCFDAGHLSSSNAADPAFGARPCGYWPPGPNPARYAQPSAGLLALQPRTAWQKV